MNRFNHSIRIGSLCALLTLSACQSTTNRFNGEFDADSFMPGKEATIRYSYLTQAINDLEQLLKQKNPAFDAIQFAPDLLVSASVASNQNSAELRQLATTQLASSAPYQLVSANTHNGRLEFRSLVDEKHVSITVVKSDMESIKTKHSYQVSDIFTQISLRDLASENPVIESVRHLEGFPFISSVAIRRAKTNSSYDDTELLEYFNEVSLLERDRKDILQIRAMLSLRLGNDKQASSLIQRGIVRYPDTPSFFILAENLFNSNEQERSNADNALKAIMKKRFNSNALANSRNLVSSFLNS